MNAELDSANKVINKRYWVLLRSHLHFHADRSLSGRGEFTKSYIPVIAAKFESGTGMA